MKTSRFLFSSFIPLFAGLFIYSCESERYWSNPHDPNTDLLPEDWRPKNLIILNNSDNEIVIHWEYDRENIEGFQLESRKDNEDWKVVNAFINKSLRKLIVQFNGTPLDSMDIDYRIMAYAASNQSAYDTTIINENAVKIVGVDYDLDSMHISWEKYLLNDFDYYQILSSEDSLGIKTIVDTIFQVDVTSLFIDEYNPLKENWFWSRAVTETGKGFIGEGRTNIVESAPNPIDILSVEYDLTKMTVTWEMSDDLDFASYELLGPDNQSMKFTTSKYDTNFITNDFDPLKENWYNIKVTDYWGLDSTGEGMTNDINEPPNSISIISIVYQISPLQMTISWESSLDWDFLSYKVQYSDTYLGERMDINVISEIETTSYDILEFDPTIERWYWMVTTDHWGQSTFSDGYRVYDEPPSQGMLHPIIFDDSSFFIKWKKNLDEDFAFYRLLESGVHNNNIPTEIYSTVNKTDTSFTVTNIESNDYRFYQVIYEDIWGAQTLTNIENGISYKRFYKTFGGPKNDVGTSIQEISDGGYIIGGYTKSFGSGSYDALILKIDADGNEQWLETFGGVLDDRGHSIQETNDGGFILVGTTNSYDNGSDIWLIKTNSEGVEEWNQVYGETGTEEGYSVQQTYDGGYIITGYTNSFNNESFDIYLIKTASDGTEEWSKSIGTEGLDKGYSVQQTYDFGYVICGITASLSNEYDSDIWLVKTDSNGEEIWTQTFGSISNDYAFMVEQANDNGFIIIGYTEIFGGENEDILLIKTQSDGQIEWNHTFGGNGIDHGYSIINTIDGGYMIIGFTESFGVGNKDVWLIKTDSNGIEQWNQNIGQDRIDHGYSIQQTNDGGFIITGYTKSENNYDDILLIKTDPLGNTQLEN